MGRRKPLEPERWLSDIRKSWGVLAQAAAWVMGVLGGFLIPAPVGAEEGAASVWVRLAQFLITVLVGFMIVAGHKWSARRHSSKWLGVSALALLLGLGGFFTYRHLADTWTAQYAGKRVVVGGVLTEHGQYNLARHPDLTASELVEEFAGDTEQIWEPESIRRRRMMLAGAYLVCLPLLTVCLLSLLQGMQCLQQRKRSE